MIPAVLVGLSGIIGVGKSTLLKRLCSTGVLDRVLREQEESPRESPRESPSARSAEGDSSRAEGDSSRTPLLASPGAARRGKRRGKRVHFCYMQEPTDVWRQHNWLERFYADPDKRALSFQLLVFDSHVNKVQETLEQARREAPEGTDVIVCIMERSMWDQRLFWQAQVLMGRKTADSMDSEAYMCMWSKWKAFIPEVSLIFHCKTENLEECTRRVMLRSRAEESALSEDYQKVLQLLHKVWFSENRQSTPCKSVPCTLLHLDAPFHSDDKELLLLARTMVQAMRKNELF